MIPLALLCLVFTYLATKHPVHDFANYYFGGQLLAEGRFTVDIYFPYWFNQQIVATGQSAMFAGFAPNTPFLAFLFIPLSALPLAIAKLLFNCVSVAVFIISCCRLSAFYNIKPVWMLLIPVVFFVPLRNEILFGQVYLLLFFFIAEYWLAYQKQRHLKASVFLSLAILLKVFPVLLLAVFIFKREIRPLLYTAVSCVAFVAVTLIFCKIDVWQFYFTDVLSKASSGGIASAYVENYQSVYMFLKRILVFEQTENPTGCFDAPLIFGAAILAIKILIAGIGFYITRRLKTDLPVIGYWMLAIIIISPYGSTYTFLFMFFPFLAITRPDIPEVQKALLLGCMIFANNFPLSVFIENTFPFNYWRLFGLAGLFILFISLFWKTVSWKNVVALSCAGFLFAAILGRRAIHPDYLINNSPLLIYSYHLRDNSIIYDFWDQHGSHRQSVGIAVSTVAGARLTGNEIYFDGKQVTTDNGHKRNPIVINGKTLLYLSDADRGIGFFTLRKLDLNKNRNSPDPDTK
jgi:uncharacterized membrane protein YqjE